MLKRSKGIQLNKRAALAFLKGASSLSLWGSPHRTNTGFPQAYLDIQNSFANVGQHLNLAVREMDGKINPQKQLP